MWLRWIIIFSLTTPAWGYQLTQDFMNGFYWSTLPINITVIETNPARKAMLEDLSRAAIDQWETSSGLSLWDYTGSGTNNIIRWSTNFENETRMNSGTTLAVAIRYTKGPYFARTEIVINGSHIQNQNEANLRTTITHELGHTMGLDHSEVGQAVMAPTLQSNFTNLHFDDIQGVQAAQAEMDHRQVTGYVSPLAYETEESSQPLSCGTIGPVTATSGVSANGMLSLASGILISFIRKLLKWFKSRI